MLKQVTLGESGALLNSAGSLSVELTAKPTTYSIDISLDRNTTAVSVGHM